MTSDKKGHKKKQKPSQKQAHAINKSRSRSTLHHPDRPLICSYLLHTFGSLTFFLDAALLDFLAPFISVASLASWTFLLGPRTTCQLHILKGGVNAAIIPTNNTVFSKKKNIKQVITGSGTLAANRQYPASCIASVCS